MTRFENINFTSASLQKHLSLYNGALLNAKMQIKKMIRNFFVGALIFF